MENIINTINNDITKSIKQRLSPLFKIMIDDRNKMQMIESILREMPEFKKIEEENKLLKLELNNIKQNNADYESRIKLEVKERKNTCNVLEKEIYNEISSHTKHNAKNKIVNSNYGDVVYTSEEASEAEAEASEAEEEAEASEAEEEEEEEEASEAEASEAEEEAEASEAETSEAETSEAEADEDEEASEAETSEAETSEAEEEEAEASEAEASEAEEEAEEEAEASEADEEAEASEAEEEAEEEAEASEAEASEAEEEEAEEVIIVEIKGHGDFYTTNEQNGDIYKIQEDEDVGDLVGKFVNGVAEFN